MSYVDGDRSYRPPQSYENKRTSRIHIQLLAAASFAVLSTLTSTEKVTQPFLLADYHPKTHTQYYEPIPPSQDVNYSRIMVCFDKDDSDSVQEALADYKEDVTAELTNFSTDSDGEKSDIVFDLYEPHSVPCVSANVTEAGYTVLESTDSTQALAVDRQVFPAHHAQTARGGNMLLRTGADQAHHHGYNGSGFTVALLDAGVDYKTDDVSYRASFTPLSGCIGVNYSDGGLISGCDGQQERLIANEAGSFCLDGSGDCGHGHKIGQATHIAAPKADILSIAQKTIKVENGQQSAVFFLSEAVKGIDLALELDADAIVYSMATSDTQGQNCQNFFEPLNVAVQSAHDADVPILASSSNYGRVEYPACMQTQGMYAITTNDFNGVIPSDAGVDTYVLSAMGQGIPVVNVNGSESTSSGTSYASATAAGLLADMAQAFPDKATEEVITIFKENAAIVSKRNGETAREMSIKNIFKNPQLARLLGVMWQVFLPFGGR